MVAAAPQEVEDLTCGASLVCSGRSLEIAWGVCYTLFALRGGVVQLVRTLACHARGRGFESRRSRPFNKCPSQTVLLDCLAGYDDVVPNCIFSGFYEA